MQVGAAKTASQFKVEEAVHNFVHAGHHGFFYGLGKRAAAAGGLSHVGRGATPLQTSPQVLEQFLAPGSPGREWARRLVLHIQEEEKN